MRSYDPVATVYVVDDDEGVCRALTALFQSVRLPVQAFTTAEAFLAEVDGDATGCIVLDVRMPGLGGLELQRLLRERGVGLPVIVISGHADVPMAVRALKAGALDFLEKPLNEQELLDRVQECLVRHAEQERQHSASQEAEQRLERLTPREREILRHMVDGKPSKVIASELDISPKTVDVHRARVLDKMDVGSVAELVRLVMRLEHTTPP